MLKQEIKILRKIQHPNVLELIEVITTKNNIYIITEYYNQGDLAKLLKREKKLPEIQAQKIISDIINGFTELNKKGILHRDIKPANIFMHDGNYVIGDFGFCKFKDDEDFDIQNSYVGTPLYMSPECLRYAQYSEKNDVWSLGILYFEILYGYTPWYSNDINGLITKLYRQKLQIPKDMQISEVSIDFLNRCLEVDINKRMSWDDVFCHRIFCKSHSDQNDVSMDLKQSMLDGANSKIFNQSFVLFEDEYENSFQKSFMIVDAQLKLCQFILVVYQVSSLLQQKKEQEFDDFLKQNAEQCIGLIHQRLLQFSCGINSYNINNFEIFQDSDFFSKLRERISSQNVMIHQFNLNLNQNYGETDLIYNSLINSLQIQIRRINHQLMNETKLLKLDQNQIEYLCLLYDSYLVFKKFKQLNYETELFAVQAEYNRSSKLIKGKNGYFTLRNLIFDAKI